MFLLKSLSVSFFWQRPHGAARCGQPVSEHQSIECLNKVSGSAFDGRIGETEGRVPVFGPMR
jgi:hypothetical protein